MKRETEQDGEREAALKRKENAKGQKEKKSDAENEAEWGQ